MSSNLRHPKLPVRILVVEDDADMARVVLDRLALSGYEADLAKDGPSAIRALRQKPFDLVICDLMLPGCPGEDVVRFVRDALGDTPVLVISARGSISDKVDLLGLGADDYLAKPFDLDELVARVAVQLRHVAAREGRATTVSRERVIRAGRWCLDLDSKTLLVDGVPVALTRTEYRIVETLARNPRRTFTRPDLFERVWGERFAGDENTVNVHVSNLRAKLRLSGTDGYVKTVWGIGFRLAPSEEDDGEAEAGHA